MVLLLVLVKTTKHSQIVFQHVQIGFKVDFNFAFKNKMCMLEQWSNWFQNENKTRLN